ncbi:multi-sensor signal transduction histidine kinase [Crinalium epipsammum PCC 9333]|uniref:histidine kinase n=1 Tax=Crinalium epipsammum PCC 9333 TaxID=1173022 RepID=K9W5H9_9CYAN|nr:PAS domain S-box protein [Crinalium epipsammum]AFZ15012.1 multi-sensor signal transduction histidine kinase [Crinalium epipsammum PCC 9333]
MKETFGTENKNPLQSSSNRPDIEHNAGKLRVDMHYYETVDHLQPTVYKIVLVEDNPEDAHLVREMLIDVGAEQFKVMHVKQLSEAFEHITSDDCDLVLLDLSLPDGQSLDTLLQMQVFAPTIPIMVLTNLSDEHLAVQAVRQGAQDYLVKDEMDGKWLVRGMRYAIERNRLRINLEARTQELQHRETNFYNMIATNVDGMIILDTQGVVRFINPAAQAMFGCVAEEILGEKFSYSLTPGKTRELCILRPNGDTPTVEVRVVETTWEGSTAYLASLRDITARKQAEERQQMQFAVTRILETAGTLNAAYEQILEAIAKALGWVLGQVWLVDPNFQKLRLHSSWHQLSLSATNFEDNSSKITFLSGEGLPGYVWQHNQPAWIADISHAKNFPRLSAAVTDGLQTALAFPICNATQVIGVIEFYSCDRRQPDENLLQIMTDIGRQIGQFIERKQAEAALIAQESFLRQVIDTSPNLIFVKDGQGKFTLANQAVANIYGTTIENLIGKTDADFNRKSQQVEQLIKSDLESMATLQKQIIFEEKITDFTGKTHWFQTIQKPLISPDSNICQMLGISADITERKTAEIVLKKINEQLKIRVDSRTSELKLTNYKLKQENIQRSRAESALRKSEERFRQLLEQAGDAFFLHDPEGKLITVNQRACDSLGYTREELLNLTLADVEINFLSHKIAEKWQEMAFGIPITLNGLHLRKDGTTFPVEVSLGKFELDGQPHILALARDITERQRAELEIRNALEKEKQLNEFKSNFITIASHEFRTPLTSILAAAEVLEHYGYKYTEEKKLSYLHRIQSSVNHMTELLNDVLILAKVEAGKIEFKPHKIDLYQFCRELTEEMAITDKNQHKIIFISNLNESLSTLEAPSFCMDEKLLRHILINLLSNAIKYSPAGSTVRFELDYQEEKAIFYVHDQGIGIPLENQNLLFQSFYRAKNVGNISGTGLGLAIVKNAIDLHGGSINVKSDLGVGTTFTVVLPSISP